MCQGPRPPPPGPLRVLGSRGDPPEVVSADGHRHASATADFLARREEEKERERAKRARLREEEGAERELAAATEKLRKERDQYATALAQLRAKGDEAGAAELEAKLAEIDDGLAGLAERAANTQAGHVGEGVVAAGLSFALAWSAPTDQVERPTEGAGIAHVLAFVEARPHHRPQQRLRDLDRLVVTTVGSRIEPLIDSGTVTHAGLLAHLPSLGARRPRYRHRRLRPARPRRGHRRGPRIEGRHRSVALRRRHPRAAPPRPILRHRHRLSELG